MKIYRAHTTFAALVFPKSTHFLELIPDGILQRIQILGGNSRVFLNLEIWPPRGGAYSAVQNVPADIRAIYPRVDLRDRYGRVVLGITNQNDFGVDLAFVCRYVFCRSFGL